MRERTEETMPSLERDALLAQAQNLLNAPNFSKESSSRVEQLISLADRCGPQAMALRRAKVASDELDLGIRTPDNSGAGEVEQEFRQFLTHGQSVLSEKTRREMAGAVAQTRAEGEGSGITGGFVV